METESNQTTDLISGTDLELSPDTPKESGSGDGHKNSDEASSQPDRESDLVAPSQATAEIILANAEISHSGTLEEAISDEQQTDEVGASSRDITEPDTCTGESTDTALGNTTEQASDSGGSTRDDSSINSNGSGVVDSDAQDPKVTIRKEESEDGSAETTKRPGMSSASGQAAGSGINSDASGVADGDANYPVTTVNESKADAETTKKPENRSKTSLASGKAVTAPNSCMEMSDEEILKAKQRIKELAVPRKNWRPYVTYGRHPNCSISSVMLGSMVNAVPRSRWVDFKFLVLNCGIDPDEVIREFNGDPAIEKLRRKEETTLAREFKHIYPPHPKCEHSLGEIVRLSSQHVPFCLGIDARRIFVYRCYVAGRRPLSENYRRYLLGANWLARKGVSSVTTYSNQWYSEFELLRPNPHCKYSFLKIKRMAEEIPEQFRRLFVSHCYIGGKDPAVEDWTKYKQNPYYEIGRLRPHENCKLSFIDIKKLADKIPESYGIETRLHFFRRCYLEGKDPDTEDWKIYNRGAIKCAPVPDEPSGSQIQDPYAEVNWRFPHADCKYSFKDIKKMAERIPESFGPETRKRFVYHCYVDGKDPALEDWTQYDDDPYFEFNYSNPGKGVKHTLEEIKRLADKIPESAGIGARRTFVLRCWKYGRDPDKEDWTRYNIVNDKPESSSAPKPVNNKASKNKQKQAPKKAQVQPNKARSSKDASGGQSVEQLKNMAEQIKSRVSLISSLGSSTSGQSVQKLQSMAEQIESRMKLISKLGKSQQLAGELRKNNAGDMGESGSWNPRNKTNHSYQDEARFSGSNPPMVAENSSERRHESERNAEHGRSFPGGNSMSKHNWQNPFPSWKNPNHSSWVADTSPGDPRQDNNANEMQGVHKRNMRLRPNKKRHENGAWTSEHSSDGFLNNPSNPSGAGRPFIPPRNTGLNNPPSRFATQQSHEPPRGYIPNNPPPFMGGNHVHMRPPMNPPPGPAISHMPGPMIGFPPSNAGFLNNAPTAGVPFSIPPNPMAAPGGTFKVPPSPLTAVYPPSWSPMPSPIAAPPHPFPGTGFPSMKYPPCPPNLNSPSPVPSLNAHSSNTWGSSQITRPAWPEPSSPPSLKRKSTYQDSIPPKRTAAEKIGDKSEATPLYIVHSGHPLIRLSDEEMDAVENTILEAILEFDADDVKPTFKESSRSNGQYGVVCNDDFTKNWLFKFLQTHQPWPNASLRILLNEPANVRANAVLPLCRDDDEKILKFIGKQNTGLDTSKWEVMERWDSGKSKTCMNLMVDEESAIVLEKCRKVNFKLGSGEIVIATKVIVGETRKPLVQARDEISYLDEATKMNPILNVEQLYYNSLHNAEVTRLEGRSQYSGSSGYVTYDSALRVTSASGFSGSAQGIGSAPSQNWHANSGTNTSPWKHSSGSSQRASPMETSHSSSSHLSQITSDQSNFPYASTSSEPALPEFHQDPSVQVNARDRFRNLVAAGFTRDKALVFTQAYVRRQLVAQPSLAEPNGSRSIDHPHQQSNAPKTYTERFQSAYGEEPTLKFHPNEARDMLNWFHRK